MTIRLSAATLEHKPSSESVSVITARGNMSALISTVCDALRKAGRNDAAIEYCLRCFAATSYDEIVRISRDVGGTALMQRT